MTYIDSAYKEALKALKEDEVPVGAVVVRAGKIVARAHNKKEQNNDPMGHCEILAIKKACKKLKTWRLIDCDLYVTLEPCMMCLGAIIHSRIKKVYYGTIDPRWGAIEGSCNLLDVGKFNHIPETFNLNDEKCGKVLKDYFKGKRKK